MNNSKNNSQICINKAKKVKDEIKIININSLPPEEREKYKEICEWLEKQRKEYP